MPLHGQHEYDAVQNTDLSLRHPSPNKALTIRDAYDAKKASVQYKQISMPERPERAPMWQPFLLHATSLIIIAGTYLAFLTTITLLYHFSEVNHGLVTKSSSNHYAYKYGPMVIIVLSGVVWHQVDYYCRLLAPWQSLSCGPRTASQSILLDLISPLDPVVCFRALRGRHWAVAASSAGSVLLDIALVFSTALLAVSSVTRSGIHERFSVTSEFSTAKFMLNDVAPGMILWGDFDHGLSLPFGTTEELAFATPMLDSRNRTSEMVVVNVQALVPSISCEPALVHVNISGGGLNSSKFSIAATVSTSTCDLFEIPIEGTRAPNETRPVRVLTGTGDMSLCAEKQIDDNYQPWQFRVIDMRYEPLFGTSTNGTRSVTGWSAHLQNSSAIVCAPTYELRDAAVSIEVSSKKVLAVDLYKDRKTMQLNGFANYNFSLGLSQGLDQLIQQFEPKWNALENTKQETNDAVFSFMSRLNDSHSLEDFLDPKVMMDAAQKILTRFGAQMAHHGLSVRSNYSREGITQYVEERVVVQLLATIVLCTSFGLLTLLCLCILLFRPRDLVPHSPCSIMRAAAVLSASASLHDQLKEAGMLSDEDLSRYMHDKKYTSILSLDSSGYRFSVEQAQSHEKSVLASATLKKWWRPFSATKPFFALIAITVAGVITGLEVVRHFSDPLSGFLRLKSSPSVARFWAATAPTTTMVFIKLLFQSLNFSMMVFGPFASFVKGKAQLKHTMMKNMTGQIPILSFWQSVRNYKPATLLTSITVLLSTLLTIIVSNLYSVQEFELSKNFTVSSQDYFNLNWNPTEISGVSPDNQAGNIFALIDWYNLSYPVLTYNELTYPTLVISDSQAILPVNGTALRVSLPATRASLNCSFALPDRASSVLDPHAPGPHTYDTFVIGNQFEVPEICSMRSTSEVINVTSAALIFLEEGQYFSMLNTYPWSNNRSYYPGTCPTFGVTFGFTGRHSNSTRNITSLSCYQMVEEVDTITTFLWPTLKVDPSTPPIINESSARILMPNLEYKLDKIVANEFGNLQYAPLEAFFLHVINGTEGTPAEQLLGPDNQEQLLTAVQHVYRRYMAQAINLNMRMPVETASTLLLHRDSETGTRSYQATFVNPHGLCIVQNRLPQIILEIVLAVMLIFALTAFLCTPMANVLPHNPLTIAGIMSLVAGGSLSHQRSEGGAMPEGAEWLQDTEVHDNIAKSDGPVYVRLGWWRRDGSLLAEAEHDVKKKRYNKHEKGSKLGRAGIAAPQGGFFGINVLRGLGHFERR